MWWWMLTPPVQRCVYAYPPRKETTELEYGSTCYICYYGRTHFIWKSWYCCELRLLAKSGHRLKSMGSSTGAVWQPSWPCSGELADRDGCCTTIVATWPVSDMTTAADWLLLTMSASSSTADPLRSLLFQLGVVLPYADSLLKTTMAISNQYFWATCALSSQKVVIARNVNLHYLSREKKIKKIATTSRYGGRTNDNNYYRLLSFFVTPRECRKTRNITIADASILRPDEKLW